mmetsp:Transcript_8605/g.14952  ORF Transcript_8605/g.14952 Transcript_8605/m.14952 type:complete len:132 (+) Transcript_8605:1349-1744(+)
MINEEMILVAILRSRDSSLETAPPLICRRMRDGVGGAVAPAVLASELWLEEEPRMKEDMSVESPERAAAMPTPPALSSAESLRGMGMGEDPSRLAPRLLREDVGLLFMVEVLVAPYGLLFVVKIAIFVVTL